MCEHLHEHKHHHEHPHDHEHLQEASSPAETLALLNYMLGHNRHHAQELHELAHGVENAELVLCCTRRSKRWIRATTSWTPR